MDIDFSLVLVILVCVSGVIWMLDTLFLLPRRKKAVQNYAAGRDIGVGQLENLASLPKVDQDTVAKLKKESLPVEYSRSFFPVLLLVLVLRSFLMEPFTIPSSSMVPTLRVGDYILVNKFTYGLRLPVIGTKIMPLNDPQTGDVMVFKYPGNPRINYIKRVIGVPGDTIHYENKRLTINGKEISQSLLAELPPSNPTLQILQEQLVGDGHTVQHILSRNQYRASREWKIPEGSYFMMGDNRDNSNDSRVWGMVPEKYIVGKAVAIWMTKQPGLHLPAFSRVGGIE
ncbi:MAG: signal peptidase I [Pseudomonadales bacterium]|nr:signal peptidase I [Pseudomonadales bacterium]